MQETSTSNTGLIAGVIITAVLIFAGLTWAILSAPSGTGPVTGNVTFNDGEKAPFVGPADAAVTVHIYGDFQCPACKNAEPGVRAAMQQFQDRVKFIWKDFPLLTIHRNARAGSNAARCAQDQGKFWQMHDLLYAQQESWAEQSDPSSSFSAYANQLGLDPNAFNSCYRDKKFDNLVMADEAEGTSNGVNATPTFYVNNTQYVGMAADQWAPILNTALASATTTK